MRLSRADLDDHPRASSAAAQAALHEACQRPRGKELFDPITAGRNSLDSILIPDLLRAYLWYFLEGAAMNTPRSVVTQVLEGCVRYSTEVIAEFVEFVAPLPEHVAHDLINELLVPALRELSFVPSDADLLSADAYRDAQFAKHTPRSLFLRRRITSVSPHLTRAQYELCEVLIDDWAGTLPDLAATVRELCPTVED
jgi:hypothetical protein